MKYKHQISSPELQWDQNNQPFSERYEDVYYSVVNGLAETDHVFIDGNQLQERFRQNKPDQCFRILECGFGSGLNFLRSCWHWQQLNSHGNLHFCSIEAQPLSSTQLQRALTSWQKDIPEQIASLLAVYTSIQPGLNKLQVTEHISLELVVCDINELNHELASEESVDAIFMDGFAPGRNPDMWQQSLCQLLFNLARPGATLATYSVAGVVRRHLTLAGFEIEKAPGFGNKRHMLKAYKAAS